MLPALNINDWRDSRDSIHQYARIMGKVRSTFMPRTRHWWHITLYVNNRGLTTSSFIANDKAVVIELDLIDSALHLIGIDNWRYTLKLSGQTSASVAEFLRDAMQEQGIILDPNVLMPFDGSDTLHMDVAKTDDFRRAVNWINLVFREFKGRLSKDTGPVHLFPHHLDISLNWFSGRLVPGQDPEDEENADEQMNFGFVTGDASIEEAYFYATAYPNPGGWGDIELPGAAYWHTDGWTGGVLPYSALVDVTDPRKVLLDYLHTMHEHGSSLMR